MKRCYIIMKKFVANVTALSTLHFQVIVISLARSACQQLHLFVSAQHVSSDCDQVLLLLNKASKRLGFNYVVDQCGFYNVLASSRVACVMGDIMRHLPTILGTFFCKRIICCSSATES